MYSSILSLHNLIRWAVLIIGITATYRSIIGLSGRKEWTSLDYRWGTIFALTMDIQFLLGLILYVYLSPITQDALSHFSSGFKDSNQRFFVLIHLIYMVLAITFTHLGNILPRKTDNPPVKHLRAATFFTLAMFSMLLGIPWSRPLFPGF